MVRTRNYLLAFAAGALLAGAAAWGVRSSYYGRTIAEWRSWLSETAENRAAMIALWLTERRSDARVIGTRPEVRAALRAGGAARGLPATLDSVAQEYGFDAVLVVRRDGSVAAASRSAAARRFATSRLVARSLADDSAFIEPVRNPGEPLMLAVAAPVRGGGGGAPLGAALLLISPDRRLFPIALHEFGRADGEVILARIVAGEAWLIAATWDTAGTGGMSRLGLDTAGGARARLFGTGSPFERYVDYDGKASFASSARVPGIDWMVVVKVPVAQALAGFRRSERLVLLALLLALAALGLGLRVLARRAEAQERETIAQIQASERRFRDLMETVDLLAVIVDPAGRIVFCNDALLALAGWTREELVGRDGVALLADPAAADGLRAALAQVVREGRGAAAYDATLVTRDGRRRRIRWNGTVLRGADGAVEGLAAIGDDVTPLREVEDALRQSEERYRVLVESARDAIFVIDAGHRLAWLNPAFEAITGWPREQWLGRPFEDILVPEDRPGARAVFARLLRNDDGDRPTAQFRLRTADGEPRIGEFTGAPQIRDGRVVGILGVCRDITERVTMEQHMRQASRMEAVGQLAGGVAHDFNNLLTVIIGSSELLLSDVPADSPLREDVQEIRNSAGRAAMLTRQLLAFSRRQMLELRETDLNSIVTGAAGMLRRLIGEHIALDVRLGPGLGQVRADPGQLEQVIVNLAVNARDAMSSGGTLTIATSELANAQAVPVGSTRLPPGRWCVLEVRDDGSGMTPEIVARVFEPFFTTKPPGQGTGLGLASVYGVIKQSEGFIAVDSAPGAGSAFRIYLPRLAEGGDPQVAAAAKPPAPRGTETVLLVEDETSVRAVAMQALVRHGYRVLEAAGGQEALGLMATGAGHVDLLLSDVVMPGMNGPELAERLKQRRPGLKVLFTSGYVEHAVDNRGLFGGAPLLTKPFTPEQLARRVREVLDQK